jgi:hypothetical protein
MGAYTRGLTYSGIADTLDNLTGTMKWAVEHRDRQDRQAKEDQERDLRMRATQFTLDRAQKEARDKDESAELMAAMQSGDLSGLRPELADKVNRQMESQGITPEMIVRRTTAAKTMTPIIGRLAAESERWKQAAAGSEGPDFVSLAGTDAQGFNDIKPYLADLFFGKDRFNDKDGAPKLHKYAIGGRTVYGVVDQANPVRDVLFHASSGKVSVPLNVRAVATDDKGKPLKDASGGYVYDDAVQIPGGIATQERGTGPDEAISSMTLPELQQKIQELATSGELALQLRKKALEAEYVKRSPEVQSAVARGLGEEFARDRKSGRVQEKIARLKESDAYKQASSGVYGGALQVLEDLAADGLINAEEFGKTVSAVSLKDDERKQKTAEDESSAQALLVGYSQMTDLPRTAALAKELLGKPIGAKQAVEVLKAVAGGEQRQQDNKNKVAAARAGRAESASSAQIRTMKYLEGKGMTTQEAANTVFGITKTEMTTQAGDRRARLAALQKDIGLLEEKLMTAAEEERPEILRKLAQRQMDLDDTLAGNAPPQKPSVLPALENSMILNNGQPVGIQGGLTHQPADLSGPRRASRQNPADKFYR